MVFILLFKNSMAANTCYFFFFYSRMQQDYYVLKKFIDNSNTRSVDNPMDSCQFSCQAINICKVSYSSFDEVLTCLDKIPPIPQPTTPVPTDSGQDTTRGTAWLIVTLLVVCFGY